MAELNCKCSACARCCKFLPGALARVSDLEKLENETRLPQESEEEWASRMLVASAGTLIGYSRDGGPIDIGQDSESLSDKIDVVEIPTLALKSNTKGHCVHFKIGRCSIYKGRPSGCSEFDSCTQTDEEAEKIGLPMHIERYEHFKEEGRYARLWNMLHEKGQRRSRSNVNKRVKNLNKIYKRKQINPGRFITGDRKQRPNEI